MIQRGKGYWRAGDIVQIDPNHDEVFGAALMIVTEPKSWGAQGYFNVPGENYVFYRVKFEDAVKVGQVEWIREADPEDE